MAERQDAVTWFMERQRLLCEVIEGTRYDLEEHAEALDTVPRR